MSCFDYTAFWLVIAVISYKLWVKLSTGWCKSNVCLVGKTAIITGGNTGIGYETAADLAKRGCRVIIACRREKEAISAVKKLIEETDNPNILYKPLDLCSFKSVREFAKDINKTEKRLDILINNAGAGILPKKINEDGMLNLMQTNYFGHFLLTNLLLDLLKKTGHSRIVNVSSFLALFPFKLDLNNLNKYPNTCWNSLNDLIMYCRTKLCIVLFTIELTERLKGTTVTTYSLHPGVIHTKIFQNHPGWLKYPTYLCTYWIYKNVIEGAQTSVYCAVAKNIEHLSGDHFQDCHVMDRYPNAWNPELARGLWEVSEKLVKLHDK
ncbi:retinol dehydrogenase 11-like [Sitophilus oryzae]|uniref:Retinol dehydrogenase 11-like n=1 Tax=Sitophilus oryzae TaxID=7048 RepID=A0A6J2YYM2_SITOR|nr:retinol dehydrogenase 11-like [Sitophilus oryzae]